MTAISLPAVRRADPRAMRRLGIVVLAVAAAVLYVAFQGSWLLPHDDDAALFRTINGVRDWVEDNRNTNALFVYLIGPIRVGVDAFITGIIDLLQALGWPGIIAIGGALGWLTGGWRIAAIAVLGFVCLGGLGLWQESVDTLGLTLGAVVLSLAIGIPLGILAARSDRFQRLITPVLDAMQIMPTFAFLAPFALLFRIGEAPSAIVTLIYAMPAAIRITALGIRTVPPASVEAAASLGATRWQVLRKVQLPLARRVIGLAVNQTIMLALGMVVVTVLIDAPGLGEPIIRSLERNDVGGGFDAGLAVVILAIVLDRLTEHASERMDSHVHLSPEAARRRRRLSFVALAIAVAGVVASRLVADPTTFPDAISFSVADPVNTAVDWITLNLFPVTDAIKNVFTEVFLNPFEGVLVSAPWWLVVAVVLGVGVLVAGWRPALVAAACLVLVAALQLWEHGMVTLASVLVATVLTLAVGIVLGVLAARSDRFSTVLRPGLDFAQTMPSFVYLLPALALFQPSRFTAIIAALIYAVPPVIRLVEAGIRAVPASIVEAAVSAGATERQLLWKVRLPVSLPALLLAANQGIILVLAMVVVGGLVGAGALGYDVVAGFAQREDFGKGFAAGIALVLLGIMLDRVTRGAGMRRSGGEEIAEAEVAAATVPADAAA